MSDTTNPTPKPAMLQGVHVAQARLHMPTALRCFFDGMMMHLVDSPIPADAILKAISHYDAQTQELIFIVEHPSFPLWKPGEIMPTLRPIVVTTGPIAPAPAPTMLLGEGGLTHLQLDPGDMVVLLCKEMLSQDTKDRLATRLEQIFEGHRALVLDCGMTIGKITAQQAIRQEENHGDPQEE